MGRVLSQERVDGTEGHSHIDGELLEGNGFWVEQVRVS